MFGFALGARAPEPSGYLPKRSIHHLQTFAERIQPHVCERVGGDGPLGGGDGGGVVSWVCGLAHNSGHSAHRTEGAGMEYLRAKCPQHPKELLKDTYCST